MFSDFRTFSFSLLALAISSSLPVQGAVSHRALDDVWNPTILHPTTGDVWYVTRPQNVTWDTSNAPASISNEGKVLLAQNGVVIPSGPGSSGECPVLLTCKRGSELMIACFWGMIGEPLAQGFDLRAGFVTVTCPVVTPDDNYEIVVSPFK